MVDFPIMILEVEENPNCAGMDMMRFKEMGPPRRLRQVRIYDRKDAGEWCQITGWNSQEDHPHCAAYAQPIEDSGVGIAYLVYGGDWGIRLKPITQEEGWDLNSAQQWGEPYLALTQLQDLIYAEEEIREEKTP